MAPTQSVPCRYTHPPHMRRKDPPPGLSVKQWCLVKKQWTADRLNDLADDTVLLEYEPIARYFPYQLEAMGKCSLSTGTVPCRMAQGRLTADKNEVVFTAKSVTSTAHGFEAKQHFDMCSATWSWIVFYRTGTWPEQVRGQHVQQWCL